MRAWLGITKAHAMTLSSPPALTLPAALLREGFDQLCADLSPSSDTQILDASGVQRVGTLALQWLLAAQQAASAAGGQIVVQNPSPAFAEAVQLLGLDALLSSEIAA
jgi:anti-anti-sigma regulatory factor